MTILQWHESIDGNFGQSFVDYCFPEKKVSHHPPQSVESDLDEVDADSIELRQTLVDIVLAWTHDYAGGVILKSEDKKQSIYQAFEFISPHKRVLNDKMDSEPLVFVSYAISTSVKQIKLLLRDEKVVVITCPDRVALHLARHFESNFQNSALIDFVSGLKMKEGFLGPMCPYPQPLMSQESHTIDDSRDDTDDDGCEYYDSGDRFFIEGLTDSTSRITLKENTDITSQQTASNFRSSIRSYFICTLTTLLLIGLVHCASVEPHRRDVILSQFRTILAETSTRAISYFDSVYHWLFEFYIKL